MGYCIKLYYLVHGVAMGGIIMQAIISSGCGYGWDNSTSNTI